MLTTLLATRVIGPMDIDPGTPGDVVTPTERFIRIGRAGSARPAVSAREPIDPSDVLDFVVDLSALLEAGEEFATISFTVMAEASALGFRVMTEAPYAPLEVDHSHLRLWATIADGSRDLAAWNGGGTTCLIEFTATTNSVPARTWQRTIAMRVAQR